MNHLIQGKCQVPGCEASVYFEKQFFEVGGKVFCSNPFRRHRQIPYWRVKSKRSKKSKIVQAPNKRIAVKKAFGSNRPLLRKYDYDIDLIGLKLPLPTKTKFPDDKKANQLTFYF